MSNKIIEMAMERYKEDGKIRFLLRVLRTLIVRAYSQLKLLRYRLRFKNRFVTKTILGNKMALNMDDKGMSTNLIIHELWEKSAVQMVEGIAQRGNVVVDIGSNIGYYALLEARLVGENGKVFAIEPVDENLRTLKKNIVLNDFPNIEVFQLAIGDENKHDNIYVSDFRNQSSMIHREDLTVNKKTKKQAIEVMTLDRFLEDKPTPDLIRMDVEGYEYEIIMGMTEFFKSSKPLKILMELHIYSSPETELRIYEMLEMLYRHGFELKIGAWESWESKSRILTNVYDFLSRRIDPDHQDFFHANTLEDLRNIVAAITHSGKASCPHVLFQRG